MRMLAALMRSRPKRIVIADDHEATRVLLRILLGHEPHLDIVGEAADGDEAVKLAIEQGAEIVLLDVLMPRLDGFEAAERIRTAHPEARLILHTAEPGVIDPARERRLGVRVITKADFRATIEAVRAAALGGEPQTTSKAGS
jgi:DNA-binding NarL/FixJ family response regulator